MEAVARKTPGDTDGKFKNRSHFLFTLKKSPSSFASSQGVGTRRQSERGREDGEVKGYKRAIRGGS